MAGLERENVARVLNRLHEVRWDRCVPVRGDDGVENVTAFGWIEREDGRHDFAVLDLWPYYGGVEVEGMTVGMTTSSAALSAEFSARLYGEASGHLDCERVADVFGDLVHRKVELAVEA